MEGAAGQRPQGVGVWGSSREVSGSSSEGAVIKERVVVEFGWNVMQVHDR